MMSIRKFASLRNRLRKTYFEIIMLIIKGRNRLHKLNRLT